MNATEIWTTALRSGKYEQGREYLSREGKMCCLGVACDLFIKEGNELAVGEIESGDWDGNACMVATYGSGVETQVAPFPVKEWLGLKTGNGSTVILDRDGGTVCLAALNDEGFTFEQIADIIDAGLAT